MVLIPHRYESMQEGPGPEQVTGDWDEVHFRGEGGSLLPPPSLLQQTARIVDTSAAGRALFLLDISSFFSQTCRLWLPLEPKEVSFCQRVSSKKGGRCSHVAIAGD